MFVGHFAVGFLAKRVEPKLSLGTAVLAAMLADFLWCIFMIAGIEQVRIKPGIGAANYLDAINVGMSHSLLMDAVWAALFAAVYLLIRHYPRGALVLFAAVLSHWVLDWISHRPDMQLAPGAQKYFGLGLWASIPATLLVEGGLWLFAIIVYARTTRPLKRTGVYAFWIVIPLLTLLWYNNIAGPPPPNVRSIPFASLTTFSLLIAWIYWINHLRPERESQAPIATI